MTFPTLIKFLVLTLLLSAAACKAKTPEPETPPVAHEGMKSGLITITAVQLEGDAYYPEYGLTPEFFKARIDQLFSHTGQALSMTEIHKIADSITLAYREKGLTFNQAYVIPQEITHATLRIHVLAGKLAEIDLFNHALYSKEQILAPFKPLIGKVIYEPAIKAAVSELTSKPGLKLFTYFSVGSRQGETRLNIRVMHEDADKVSVAADNYGINQTGENRLMLDYQRHNLFSLSGKLNLSLLATEASDNLFGGVAYQAPIDNRQSMGIAYLHSEYSVAGEFSALGLTGHLSNTSVYWSTTNKLDNEAPTAHNFRLQYSFKQSNTESQAFTDLFDSKIRYSQLLGRYQFTDSRMSESKSRLRQEFTLSPALYKTHDAVNTQLPNRFSVIRASYQLLLTNWINFIDTNHLLQIKTQGQWTDDKLPGAEFMVSTGPTTNRGYAPGIFNGDNGASITIEETFYPQMLPASGNVYLAVHPSLFIDASYIGNQHEEVYASFTSVGFGLSLESQKGLNKTLSLEQLSARLTAGYPVTSHYSETTDEPVKDITVYGRLSLSF